LNLSTTLLSCKMDCARFILLAMCPP
jgi:hypothetical protein